MPDSLGHLCCFTSQTTKTLQLKKRLNFNMQKFTLKSKLHIDCIDCGTVYVLITKLHLQLAELSKTANIDSQ